MSLHPGESPPGRISMLSSLWQREEQLTQIGTNPKLCDSALWHCRRASHHRFPSREDVGVRAREDLGWHQLADVFFEVQKPMSKNMNQIPFYQTYCFSSEPDQILDWIEMLTYSWWPDLAWEKRPSNKETKLPNRVGVRMEQVGLPYIAILPYTAILPYCHTAMLPAILLYYFLANIPNCQIGMECGWSRWAADVNERRDGIKGVEFSLLIFCPQRLTDTSK